MLSSIHPFGERSRNSIWGVTATAYVVGATIGGAVTGSVFGVVGELGAGWIGPRAALYTLGIAAVVSVAADLRWIPISPPGPHRQVNERWLMEYRGWVYGLGFGLQIGAGLCTIVATMTVWLMLVAVILASSWPTGLLVGATFGATRGLAILAGARAESPAQLRAMHRTIADHAASVHHMAVATAGLTAVTAITLGVTA
jgi:MFS family permease